MDDSMYVWDAENGAVILRMDNEHQGGVRAVAADSAGRRAVTGDCQGNVFLWDLEHTDNTFSERISVADEPVNVWCADWVGDTNQVAVGGIYLSGESMLVIYDVEEHRTIQEFRGHMQKVLGVRASHDGKLLYSTGDNVRGWTIETADQFFEFNEHDDEVFAVDESPDGKTLASGGTDGTIRIIALPKHP